MPPGRNQRANKIWYNRNHNHNQQPTTNRIAPGKKPFTGPTAHLRPEGLAEEDLAQPVAAPMAPLMGRESNGSGPREVAF